MERSIYDVNFGLRQRPMDSDPDEGTESEKPDGETDRIQMKRNVGLVSGIALIVGPIIGSGVFIFPKTVLLDTGSAGLSLIVWAVAGLLSLMGALSYAELGTLIRLSGGEYAYLRITFGNIFAYLYAWTSLAILHPTTIAVMCLVFAEYLSSFFELCGQPQIPKKIIAAAALVLIGIINSLGVKFATKVQVVFTLANGVVLVIIIVGGIVKMAQGYSVTIAAGFTNSTSSPSKVALAFYGALWSYDGWNNLNYVTEEIKDPKKNLPRANIIGVLLVTVIYVLTNVSYLAVLSKQQMLGSAAVAVTWGDTVLGSGAFIIPLAVMISSFGAANGTAFGGSRLPVPIGYGRMFVWFLMPLSITPLHGVMLSGIRKPPKILKFLKIFISLLMIIPGDIVVLMDIFSFTAWFFYGLTFLSLLILRFKMKDAERPYKVPFPIPLLMFLISIYLVIAPIVDSPQIEFLYAFLFVIGGLILYLPFVHFNLKLPGWDHFSMYCQLIFNLVPTSVRQDV